VSGEESKFGWPAWQEANWESLLEPFAQVLELHALEVRGLMTMAPFLPDPEQARPYFQRLKRLQGYLAERLPGRLGGAIHGHERGLRSCHRRRRNLGAHWDGHHRVEM
jgi:uncharacterized pyridoxal phosphate-containing UPF0001 family protein